MRRTNGPRPIPDFDESAHLLRLLTKRSFGVQALTEARELVKGDVRGMLKDARDRLPSVAPKGKK